MESERLGLGAGKARPNCCEESGSEEWVLCVGVAVDRVVGWFGSRPRGVCKGKDTMSS